MRSHDPCCMRMWEEGKKEACTGPAKIVIPCLVRPTENICIILEDAQYFLKLSYFFYKIDITIMSCSKTYQ